MPADAYTVHANATCLVFYCLQVVVSAVLEALLSHLITQYSPTNIHNIIVVYTAGFFPRTILVEQSLRWYVLIYLSRFTIISTCHSGTQQIVYFTTVFILL